ncbi:hypothetical protein [Lactococcus lactis]|uniref:hypothetical protein n=1 Tax=Lactococcus lactis TaxID=1358 RepID=UPI0021A8CB61|nr:hypothetical protein [Lactococcus lactis]
MTTWTDEMKESVSKKWLNPFIVLDYKDDVVGVYRNSKQCERKNEFGFSSMGIRNCLNGRLSLIKVLHLKELVLKTILIWLVRNNKNEFKN